MSGAVAPGSMNPPSRPNVFCRPCCMNSNPAPMRRIACVAGPNLESAVDIAVSMQPSYAFKPRSARVAQPLTNRCAALLDYALFLNVLKRNIERTGVAAAAGFGERQQQLRSAAAKDSISG